MGNLIPCFLQQLLVVPYIELRRSLLRVYLPLFGVLHHIAYLHPWSQGDALLHISLHRRSLSTPARVAQAAHPAVDGQLTTEHSHAHLAMALG